ncbi:MAG: DUF2069 domain-containing protein [Gammaproteobacteria bacterium]|nr:DUF2069 domain-containing protein [Gammaproteobacteria bacterium]
MTDRILSMNSIALARINSVLAAGLALLFASWWFASTSTEPDVVRTFSLIGIIPNLLLVPGLWLGNRTATTIAGFIAPFYFAHAVMELWANPAVRGWVLVETLLSAALFMGAMIYLRGGAPQQPTGTTQDD